MSQLNENLNLKSRYELVIGGETKSTNQYQTVINPFDLSTVGEVAMATLDDLEAAVDAAENAFKSWASLSDEKRRSYCRQVAEIFTNNAEELAHIITLEQGKPLDAGGFGSRFEVGGCAGWAQATAEISLPDKTLIESEELLVKQISKPIGVVGSITPWNWPVLIAVWHILPAIRTGNTVVIKPSPHTPLSTARAVELLQEVLPSGVVNFVSGDAEIGSAMSKHPRIRKITFTGSTETGKQIMQDASLSMKRLTLELGGNDPAIILPGTPAEPFLPGLFIGSFINAGQTCGAIKRLYVHESDYEQFCVQLAEFIGGQQAGNGLDPKSAIGPIQNKPQWEKVIRLRDNALSQGAELLTGGERVGDGYCLTPAVLKGATQDMEVVGLEQFGPVLPIVKYSDVSESVSLANDSPYGLCASVWGTNPEELQQVSKQLEAGLVYVNTHAELNPMVPFAGHKSSGFGVQFGPEGLASYTETAVIYQRLAPPSS